jgi:hypothetical protein
MLGQYTVVMKVDRVALVRAAYERFNEGDISGVMEYFDDEVEFPDIVHDVTLSTRDEVQRYFESQFQVGDHAARPLEVMEIGDAIIVVTYHQAYERNGRPMGPGISAVQRLTFRGDRIATVDFTPLDAIPEDVLARLR